MLRSLADWTRFIEQMGEWQRLPTIELDAEAIGYLRKDSYFIPAALYEKVCTLHPGEVGFDVGQGARVILREAYVPV